MGEPRTMRHNPQFIGPLPRLTSRDGDQTMDQLGYTTLVSLEISNSGLSVSRAYVAAFRSIVVPLKT